MADKKVGRIVYSDKQKNYAVILEEGEKSVLHKFSPELVGGNLDPEDKEYPARLRGQNVIFISNENGAVVSVSTFVFRMVKHDRCYGDEIAGVKACGCGKETLGSYTLCEVCALELGRCAKCGDNIP